MTQHTPAPWSVGKSKSGKECVWLNGLTEPRADTMGPPETWIDCNTEANAHLISAAPDLLEALEGLAGWFDSDSKESADHHLKKAKAAIAKATGA